MLRYVGLDALRVFAISVVVLKHLNYLLPESLNAFVIYLPDPVDLFFVLSGFLIGNIFLKTYGNQSGIALDQTKRFIVRRWFRTLPLYYFFLVINIILILFQVIPGTINKYLLTFIVFYQNLFKPYDFLFWESWSLSVEEWFYFLFPIIALLISRITKDVRRSYLFSSLILIAFSALYRFLNFDENADLDLYVRKIVLCRFDIIGFGLLGAYAMNYHNNHWFRLKSIKFIIGATLWFVLFSSVYKSLLHPLVFFLGSGISILFMFPVLSALQFRGNFITYLSKISYPVYLIHLPLAYIVLKDLVMWFDILIYLTLLLGLSHLTYHYIQRPFIKIRDNRYPET